MSDSKLSTDRIEPYVWKIAGVVILGMMMSILDTTIVNVALPHIAGSLSASNDEATWALTSYLVANGIVLTISGWLSDLFGRKRYFLICIAMFTVCSFLCGIAGDPTLLNLARGLQGVGGAAMWRFLRAYVPECAPTLVDSDEGFDRRASLAVSKPCRRR